MGGLPSSIQPTTLFTEVSYLRLVLLDYQWERERERERDRERDRERETERQRERKRDDNTQLFLTVSLVLHGSDFLLIYLDPFTH